MCVLSPVPSGPGLLAGVWLPVPTPASKQLYNAAEKTLFPMNVLHYKPGVGTVQYVQEEEETPQFSAVVLFGSPPLFRQLGQAISTRDIEGR